MVNCKEASSDDSLKWKNEIFKSTLVLAASFYNKDVHTPNLNHNKRLQENTQNNVQISNNYYQKVQIKLTLRLQQKYAIMKTIADLSKCQLMLRKSVKT